MGITIWGTNCFMMAPDIDAKRLYARGTLVRL
jgi:hypothetical protein